MNDIKIEGSWEMDFQFSEELQKQEERIIFSTITDPILLEMLNKLTNG